MSLEPVIVAARWETDGEFVPVEMTWQNRKMVFDATGRSWEDAEGWHVLCMCAGQVFELVFALQPARWLVRSSTSAARLA